METFLHCCSLSLYSGHPGREDPRTEGLHHLREAPAAGAPQGVQTGSLHHHQLLRQPTLQSKICVHPDTGRQMPFHYSHIHTSSESDFLFPPPGRRLPGDGGSSPEDGVSVLAVLRPRDRQRRAAGLLRPAADGGEQGAGRAAVGPCQLDTTQCRGVTATVTAVMVFAGLTPQIPHCESMFAAKTVFISFQIPKDELDSSPKESLRLSEFNVRHMDA